METNPSTPSDSSDAYTLSVVRQDFANHIDPPPQDPVDLLLAYLAARAAIRARHRLVRPQYVNSDERLEALLHHV